MDSDDKDNSEQRLIRQALRSIPSMSKHLRSPEHNRTTLSVIGVSCPAFFFLEIVVSACRTRHHQHAPWLHKALKIVKERYNSMRHATTIVVSSCFYLQTISDAFSAQSQLNFVGSQGGLCSTI
ncbi:unnamed protein product [Camellia sinensis]